MLYKDSEFLRLSPFEQKAALETLIFSSENVISSTELFRLLISEEEPEVFTLKFDGGNGNSNDEIISDNNKNIDEDFSSGKRLENSNDLEEKYNFSEEPVDDNNNEDDIIERNNIEDDIIERVNIEDENISNETNKKQIKLTTKYIEDLIDEININLNETGRPYHIINVAGGYQFATRPEYGKLATRLAKAKAKRRLSQATLETLAIIAYKQPISKPEIERIRGVNSAEIVNSLIEKNLVKSAGRSDGLGKAILFATTDEFLKSFGLRSLEDLPKLRELEELSQDIPYSEGTIEVEIDEKTGEKIFTFKAVEEESQYGNN